MPLEYSACLDDLKFILRYILVPTAAAGGGGGGSRIVMKEGENSVF